MPNSWTIKETDRFQAERRKLFKDKGKTDQGSGKLLESVYGTWLRQMLTDPVAIVESSPEPYPKAHAEPGRDLRKIRYKLKSRGGGANHIRLIYEVHHEERCITLLTIYAHDRFHARLPDKELGRRLKAGRTLVQES